MSIDHQQQVAIWRQRFAAAPESRAFAPLADALRLAGEHAEALVLLEEGIVKHPDFQAAMVVLGHTLLDADRSEHARKVLSRVLDSNPDNVVALRLLTEDARSRQAWDEAVPLLARLSKLDPDDERWPRGLMEAKANSKSTDPRQVPQTSFATMTLVDIYLAQGYLSKAMTALQQMQVREPHRRDLQEKIDEISQLEGRASGDRNESAGSVAVGSEPPSENADGPEQRAHKRTAEKKNFEAWINRIRTDESSAP